MSHKAWPLLLLTGPLFLGCGVGRSTPTAPPPQEVYVALPVVQQITDTDVFTGRTEAVNTVEVRARVTGYLEKALFKDGADVKEGDLLFEIDPRTYRAEYQRTLADVTRAEVHFQRLDNDYKRAAALLPRKAISQEEYDKIAGDRAEAEAAVGVAKASRDFAKQNLDFCKVTAPLTGRISRRQIDPGNLVKADDTPLTVIVALDPMYVYFDVDERSLLRFRRLIQEGKLRSARETRVTVAMGLADETGFPHEGYIDFAENRVDPQTGTLRARCVFPNPNRILSPGLFARVRVPIGAPHQAILVSERALGTDQGEKFLYVVNDEDQVVYRKVRIGSLQGGLRVIDEGLEPGERVIVSGLQRVRPRTTVAPILKEMPSQPEASKPVVFAPASAKGSPKAKAKQ